MNPSSPASSENIFAQKSFLRLLIIVVIVAGIAYWVGDALGYQRGYVQAQADVASVQEEAARNAAEDAAKAANPFQAVNPLEGVEANPFEKVKKVLNPFED